MSTQERILRACTHPAPSSEVDLGNGERLRVCTDCWNRSVEARREERRAHLRAEAEANPCEDCGRHRAAWTLYPTDFWPHTRHLCGWCKRRVLRNYTRSLGALLGGHPRPQKERTP